MRERPWVPDSQRGAGQLGAVALALVVVAALGVAAFFFLGGSLVPVGGHNVLEPAAAACPLITGPWLETCRPEADALVAAGGLEIVENADALGAALLRLLEDKALREERGQAAWEVAQRLAGATDRTMALLQGLGLPRGAPLDPPEFYATVPPSDSSRI